MQNPAIKRKTLTYTIHTIRAFDKHFISRSINLTLAFINTIKSAELLTYQSILNSFFAAHCYRAISRSYVNNNTQKQPCVHNISLARHLCIGLLNVSFLCQSTHTICKHCGNIQIYTYVHDGVKYFQNFIYLLRN